MPLISARLPPYTIARMEAKHDAEAAAGVGAGPLFVVEYCGDPWPKQAEQPPTGRAPAVQVRIIQTKLKISYYDGAVMASTQSDGPGGQILSAEEWPDRRWHRRAGHQGAGHVLEAGSSSQQEQRGAAGQVISAEARGEPYSGQVAVGRSSPGGAPLLPQHHCRVVYQPGPTHGGRAVCWTEPVADSAYRAAQDALNGPIPAAEPSTILTDATSAWIWSRPHQDHRRTASRVIKSSPGVHRCRLNSISLRAVTPRS